MPVIVFIIFCILFLHNYLLQTTLKKASKEIRFAAKIVSFVYFYPFQHSDPGFES